MTKSEIDVLVKKFKIPKPWPAGFSLKPEGKRILKSLVDEGLTAEKISEVLSKTIGSVQCLYNRARIKLPRPAARASKWNSKMEEAMFYGYRESIKRPMGNERNIFKSEILQKINSLRDKNVKEIKKWHAVHLHMQSMPIGKRLIWGGADSGKKNIEADIAQIKALLNKEERSWLDPEVLEISEEAWHRPGSRRGYMSRFDYKGPGYRSGIILEECKKLVEEGCHFIGIVGGLVSKSYIKKEFHRRFKGVGAHLRDYITEHFLSEAAKELASVIPRIKKPASVWADQNKPEFMRFYISTSPIYDGPYSEHYECTYGEEVARRLQELRKDDIRVGNEGSARLEVKGTNEIDWIISPTKHRLPSKYYSTAAEREIEDKSGQSDQLLPDLWVVGTQASAIYKTGGARDLSNIGERDRPYITVPASCRLEATTVAENQEGMVIAESVNGNHFVRFWNFKDLIHREKQFITGIKDGASAIHRKIVDVIKEHGAMTVGLLSDKIGVDRQTIEEAIKFLEEPKMSTRKTWPGIFYNPKSQRYDFHLDWLQERLRHRLPKEFTEDTTLRFGCLHAGYTTTDYEHFVKVYPELIIKYKVRTLFGLGDFVAGLRHSLMHRGEIIGALNNTDQEIFAAELISTNIFKSGKKRFENALLKFTDRKPNKEELKSIISDPLVFVDFVYIDGNHDGWQLMEGTTPLVTFRDKLHKILTREINALIADQDLPTVDIDNLVDQKLIHLPDFRPVHKLPSGLTSSARHPGMARADTTSLRAQKALDALGTQVVGIANFHVATTVRKWRPDLGQCVAIQAPTQAIYTPFEGSKMKKLDFGPIFNRVLSHNGRIYMDETAYFNKPLLEAPLPKWIDVDKLKDSLGLLRA